LSKSEGRTLVALPYVSKIGFNHAFVQSLVASLLKGHLSPARIMWLGDHMIADARNSACETAIAEDAEYLFFVDSDMDFPPDTLPRLKAACADVACADMWSRGWPSFRTVMRNTGTTPEGLIQSVPVKDEELPFRDARGVELIDVCGMACTLIRVDFLKRFKEHFKDQPWFWTARHGEDATFCFNAKSIGAVIKCDFSIVAGHWGVCRNVGQDFTRDARNQPMAVSEEPMMRRMGVHHLPHQEGAVK
jgi:hypothetical protein